MLKESDGQGSPAIALPLSPFLSLSVSLLSLGSHLCLGSEKLSGLLNTWSIAGLLCWPVACQLH